MNVRPGNAPDIDMSKIRTHTLGSNRIQNKFLTTAGYLNPACTELALDMCGGIAYFKPSKFILIDQNYYKTFRQAFSPMYDTGSDSAK